MVFLHRSVTIMLGVYVHPDYQSGVCVYCGELGDTVDHLLPRNYTGDSDRKRVPVVPACQECNSTLGSNFIPDVQDRRDFVHRKYKAKYSKYLKIVWYAESDLDQFGPTLRAMLARGIEEHQRVMSRLSWPESPTYDADAWAGAWESPIYEDDLGLKVALRGLQGRIEVSVG